VLGWGWWWNSFDPARRWGYMARDGQPAARRSGPGAVAVRGVGGQPVLEQPCPRRQAGCGLLLFPLALAAWRWLRPGGKAMVRAGAGGGAARCGRCWFPGERAPLQGTWRGVARLL